jgi:CRISPR/Cas system CSM-associated protein Csm2 small subunit
MMKGLKKVKNRKFDYYLRQCRDCNGLFPAQTKKQKYCVGCKRVRINVRMTNSLTARGIVIKEGFKFIDKMIDKINKEENDTTKFNSKSEYLQ